MDDQEREQQQPQSDFDDEFGEGGLNFDDIAEADMLDFTRECKDSQTLLLKNTWSFRCLAQVQLSHSSLMRNIAFLFPPLEDPGIDAVFDHAEPDPTYDDIGVEKYINLCKDLEIVPISRVTRSLTSPILNLKFYGLSEKQIRAISETLKGNAYIEHLILQDNWLTPEMTDMLSSMLQENGALRVLTLRECRIGQSGAEKLNEALSSSQFLSELDLSFNSLGDKGLKLIQVGLCETTSLKKLNISHNELTEESGETLEKILVENKTITDIDLSWNGFYTLPGNKKLFNGFKNNDRIKWLSLAWNGISTKGAISPLTKYLRTATSLEYLDLDANRLSHGPLKMLVNAVNKNHSLVTLRIGNNPYPADEGLILLKMLASKGRDPLTFMDMENKYLPKESVQILKRIEDMGKFVKIGGILGNYVIKGPDYTKLLFDRIRFILQKPKKKKAKKDFAHFVLALPETPITKADFETQLKKKKLKKIVKDKDLVNELTNQFIVKKSKIDSLEMMRVYKEYYPDASLPPPRPKKGKKGKKGKKDKKGAAEPDEQPAEQKLEGEEVTVQESEYQTPQLEDGEVPPPREIQRASNHGERHLAFQMEEIKTIEIPAEDEMPPEDQEVRLNMPTEIIEKQMVPEGDENNELI